MQGILLDRGGQPELKTGLHFAETSSWPIKAMLKVVKTDIFSQQNLLKEKDVDKTYFNKSFLKLKVNANRLKFENWLIRTQEIVF